MKQVFDSDFLLPSKIDISTWMRKQKFQNEWQLLVFRCIPRLCFLKILVLICLFAWCLRNNRRFLVTHHNQFAWFSLGSCLGTCVCNQKFCCIDDFHVDLSKPKEIKNMFWAASARIVPIYCQLLFHQVSWHTTQDAIRLNAVLDLRTSNLLICIGRTQCAQARIDFRAFRISNWSL